jgi:hypothetical protein
MSERIQRNAANQRDAVRERANIARARAAPNHIIRLESVTAPLMSPMLLHRCGSQAATSVVITKRMAESQRDERLVPRTLVGATPESPLVLAAPMLTCLSEDAPTRDRLGRLPELCGHRRA